MSLYIKSLSEVDRSSVKLVGGKAASLGDMLQAGISVPSGFVVTTDAFRAGMTEQLKKEITEAFDKLGFERVAVRSSAVAEDAKDASWAGQLDTFLNTTRNGLIQAVEECWHSIKSERAQEYASEHNVSEADRAVGVVVQAMVDSEVSGVMFTTNPVTQSHNELLIEAVYGLGELLVQGVVTPETLVINKLSGKPVSRETTKQRKMLVYKSSANQEIDVPAMRLNKDVLDNSDISRLTKLAKQIEKHYKNVPQDIEWATSKGELYAVQSRPITTLNDQAPLPEFFNHCVKTIARPATLQRDEIVRYTSNVVHPVEVVTIPLEGTTRAYYLETENAKKLLGKCIASTDTKEKLNSHLKDYEVLKQKADDLKKLIEADPRNYQSIFKQYFNFLDLLSSFLYVGVAVDKILYPKLKSAVEEQYPKAAEQILEIVATPKDLHDYQKQRLAICELVPHYKKNPKECANKITDIVKDYCHVNEYSFVEHLSTAKDIEQELSRITLEEAEAEANDIRGAIEQNPSYIKHLAALIPSEPLLAQALLIKEYALLRTDRIDRLKLVQAALRKTFEEIAKDLQTVDDKKWSRPHIANLLYDELFGYLNHKKVPDFEEIEKRLEQRYLYYFTNDTTTVVLDPEVVAQAHSIIVKPEEAQSGSLISPGTTAFRGVAVGKVVKISSPADLNKVKPGSIMVARVTMPDYTAVMKQAAGFITAEGGITSHAAIVARELSKPCIVGSDNCMEVLQDGDLVMLDSANQIVQYSQSDETSLPKWDDVEIFRWGPIPGNLFYISDYVEAAGQLSAYLGQAFPDTLLVFNEGQMVWLCDQLEMTQTGIKVFEEYVLDNKKLDHWHKEFDAASKELTSFQNGLNEAKIGRFTGTELSERLQQFYELIIKFWLPTIPAELGNYGSAEVLKARLSKFIPDNKELARAVQVLTGPEELSYNQLEELELADTKDLAAHQEKYFWLQNNYAGSKKLATAFFEKRKKELSSSERERADKQLSQVRSEKKQLVGKYNLPSDVTQLADTIWKNIIWQDERKKLSLLTFYYKAMFLKQVGKILDIKPALLEAYTFTEVIKLLQANSKQVKGRGYSGIISGRGWSLLSEEEAEVAWKAYAHEKVSKSTGKHLVGIVASVGSQNPLKAKAKIVMDPHKNTDFPKGSVLIAPMTSPDYVMLMRKASAVVTDTGGITSHAAIVSREIGIPCIVGTKLATQIIKDGDEVTIDTDSASVSLK